MGKRVRESYRKRDRCGDKGHPESSWNTSLSKDKVAAMLSEEDTEARSMCPSNPASTSWKVRWQSPLQGTLGRGVNTNHR